MPALDNWKGDNLLPLRSPAVVLAKPGRPAQCHLLSGLAVCGLCGSRLYVPRLNKVRTYVCVKGNGCGRLAVRADRAEDVVVQRVLRRLARQPLRRPAVPEPAADAQLNTFARQVSALYNQHRQRAISHTDYLGAVAASHATSNERSRPQHGR